MSQDAAFIKNIPLFEIMTQDVITISEKELFSMVYEKLKNHKIRHLPVVNEKNELIGIITQRDLYRAHSPRETEEGLVYEKTELDRLALKHFMAPDPAVLTPTHTIKDALTIFVNYRYGCIPIVTPFDKRLVGIVTHSSILKYVLRSF